MTIPLKRFSPRGSGTAALVALFCLSCFQAAHAVSVFMDRALWEAAVTGITTDPFDNAITGGTSIDLDSGIVSTQLGTVRPGQNGVNTGLFNAEIGNAFGVFTSIQWDFPSGIRAFGADFNAFNHHGISGNFDGLATQTFALPQAVGFPFFGIVGDASFSTVTFREIGGNLGSGIQIDNASFATGVAPIPEPRHSLLLMALGAGLLVAIRRRGSAGRAVQSE